MSLCCGLCGRGECWDSVGHLENIGGVMRFVLFSCFFWAYCTNILKPCPLSGVQLTFYPFCRTSFLSVGVLVVLMSLVDLGRVCDLGSVFL